MEPAPPAPAVEPPDLDAARQVWPELAKLVGLKLWKGLGLVVPDEVEPPSVLVIHLGAGYNWIADDCEAADARRRIEQGLHRLLRRPASLRFVRSAEPDTPATTPAPAVAAPSRPDHLAGDPMIQKVVELFEARPVHLELEEEAPPDVR